jgi:hypothetical protein
VRSRLGQRDGTVAEIALFPLTPALSLGERENVEDRFVKFASNRGISHHRFASPGNWKKRFLENVL